MSKVPAGWELTTLEKFISIKHGFAFKSEFFSEQGDFVLLTPGHFYEHGGFREQKHKTKYYTGNIPDGYILDAGDVLLAMTEQAAGLLGSAIFVPQSNKYLHNQRLGLINITEPKRVDLTFLYLIYNSPDVRKKISEQASGTKVKHTSPDRLRNVLILLPPLPEQKKIAQILSTWDKAIATTEQLIGNSQQQKKALMQSLLTGYIKFQGFPQWRKDTLGNIVGEIHGGGTPSREVTKYWTGDIPWVTVKDLTGYKISNAKEFISQSGVDNSATKLVPAGTVILCTRMAVGKAVVAECEVAINQDLKAIYPSQFVLSDYLHNWFIFRKEVIEKMGTGSTVKGVQISAIKSLAMSVPSSLKEQQKIAQILTAADNEIELLQKKLAFLKQEKAALMQQLLTGKRRVKINAKEECMDA